jgi:anti-anti-sigma regulatory factor
VILRARGLLDTTTADLFDAAVTEIDCASLSLFVIDLQEVEWVDPVGFTSVLRASEWCKESDTALTLIRPRGLASRVFTLTRVPLGLEVLAAALDPE